MRRRSMGSDASPSPATTSVLKEQLRAKIACATEALRALEALEAVPRCRSEGPKPKPKARGRSVDVRRVSFGVEHSAEPEPELFAPERREERLTRGLRVRRVIKRSVFNGFSRVFMAFWWTFDIFR